MESEIDTDAITSGDAAKLLMVDERHVRRLAAAGWFARSEGGRYVMAPMVRGYIRSLKEGRKNDTRVVSENRVREARARDLEVRTARAARELGPIDELEAVLDATIGNLRNGLKGIGAAVTRDLDLRKKFDNALESQFARTQADAVKGIAALRKGCEAPPVEPAPRPGRMGGLGHRIPPVGRRSRTA